MFVKHFCHIIRLSVLLGGVFCATFAAAQTAQTTPLSPELAAQLGEAYALDGLEAQLMGLGRQATTGALSQSIGTAIADAVTERQKAGPLPQGAAMWQDPALQQGIRDRLRAELKAALPDLVRTYYLRGLLGNAVGADTIAQAEGILAGIADHASTSLNANLDRLVEQGYGALMARMVPCWSGGALPCPIAGFDPTDLRGSITTLVSGTTLVHGMEALVGDALGAGTVANIRDRLTTALQDQLPPEAIHYLKAGPEAFRKYAAAGRALLPTAQLARLKNGLLGLPILTIPNGVYGAMLAASAAKHFARVICGPFCIDFYELQRGTEVVHVLQWQLQHREQITLSLAQLIDLGKYLGEKIGLPPMAEWGRFGADFTKLKGHFEKMEASFAKLDAAYDKRLKKLIAPIDAAVADIQQQLTGLQQKLLTPVQMIELQINAGLASLAEQLKGTLPKDVNGLPKTWAELKQGSGLSPGLFGAGGEKTPLEMLHIKPTVQVYEAISAQHPSNFNATDPVLLHNGELYHPVRDLTIPAVGFPLEFVRTYRSRHDFSGPLGRNWTHNYAEQLLVAQNGDVTWFTPEGYKMVFVRRLDGSYQSPRGVFSILCTPQMTPIDAACHDAPWTLLHPDRTSTRFAADGRLSARVDNFGNQLRCEYNDRGDLQRVVSASNTALQLVYDEQHRVIQLSDWTSRVWRYQYDTQGDLVAVVTPGTPQYPDGLITRYTYSRGDAHAALNHNLLTITDPKGHTYLRNTYGPEGTAFDHVIAQYYGDAPRPILVRYRQIRAAWAAQPEQAVTQVTVTDRLGQRRDYWHNTTGEVLQESIASKTGATVATTRHRYDSEGRAVERTEPDGIVWRAVFDDQARDRRSQGNRLQHTVLARGAQREWHYEYLPASQMLTWQQFPTGRVASGRYDDRGAVRELLLSGDARYQLTWNANGTLASWTDPLGTLTTYAYADPLSAQPAMIRVTGKDAGAERHFAYDPLGNLVREQDELGAVTEYRVNARNQIVEEIRPNGLRTQLAYDPDDNLSEIAVEAAPHQFRRVTKRYNMLDQLTEETIATGDGLTHTTRWSYDANGQLLQRTGPGDAHLEQTFDVQGHVITATEGRGAGHRKTRWRRDAAGRIREQIDPDGAITRWHYTPLSDVAGTTFPDHQTLRYHYDAGGRLIAAQLADAADHSLRSVRFAYDAAGRVAALSQSRAGLATGFSSVPETPDDWITWRQTYDALGHLRSRTDPLGRTHTWEYDALGRVISQRDAVGRRTAWRYDTRGAPVETRAPDGSTTAARYDVMGNVVHWTNALGQTTKLTSDLLGQLIASTDPGGHRTEWQYDGLGRVIAEARVADDPDSNRYNPDGRNTLQAAWDERNQLTQLTDDLGRHIKFSYDALGQLVHTEWPTGARETRTYTPTGQLARRVEPDGHEWQFIYGPAQELRHLQVRDAQGTVQAQRNFLYDGLQRLQSADEQIGAAAPVRSTWQYDVWGHLTDEQTGAQRVAYQFDPLGQLRRRELPDLWSEQREYDAAGRLTQVNIESASHDQSTMHLAYATDAQPRAIRYSNGGTVARNYDAAGRLTNISYAAPDQKNRYTFAVQYDASGNVAATHDSHGAQWQYDYDGADRLRRATARNADNPTPRMLQWVLDGVGNWRETEDDAQRTRFTYDDRNALRLRSTDWKTPQRFRSDAAGRMTQSPEADIAYDPFGRVSRIDDRTNVQRPIRTMTYDALNRRVSDGTTEWTYSGWQEIAWHSGDGPQQGVMLGAALDTHLAWSADLQSPVPWSPVVQDAQQHVRAIAQPDGRLQMSYDVEPYGIVHAQAATPSTTAAPSNFSIGAFGRVIDEHAPLIDFRHRDYWPELGRFVTPDPLAHQLPAPGFDMATISGSAYDGTLPMGPDQSARATPVVGVSLAGAMAFDAIEPNLYQFARNNPLRFGDPDGRRVTITQPDPALPTSLQMQITAEYAPDHLPENFPTLFADAVQHYWGGAHANVNSPEQPWTIEVTTDLQIREGRRDYSRHYISGKPFKPRKNNILAYVNERGGELMVINTNQFPTDTDEGRRHTLAHEVGHWLGLKDRYDRDTGIPDAGYEDNLMGCLTVTERCRVGGGDHPDIEEILEDYRKGKLNKYLNQPHREAGESGGNQLMRVPRKKG